MTGNPWLAEEEPGPVPAPRGGDGDPAPRWRRWEPGAEVDPPASGLGTVDADGGWWVVGAHGGAGASTWAHLLGARDAGTAWPVPGPGGPRTLALVVARTSAQGVAAARDAAVQWASGDLPGVVLVGLVLGADAPGRLPRPLRGAVAALDGAYPVVVSAGWQEAWRTAATPQRASPGREVRRLVSVLEATRQQAEIEIQEGQENRQESQEST